MSGGLRIAMVAACPFPSRQGSQVFVREMCERLGERGHDVHLVTYGQGEPFRDERFTHHRTRRLPGDDAMRSGPTLLKPVLDAMLAFSLDRLLSSARFDVVHCHNYEAAAVGIAVRTKQRVPVVYHSHNLMGDELPTYFDRPRAKAAAGRFGRLLDSQIPRRADHTVALCDQSAGVLRELGVGRERISVVPPAVGDSTAFVRDGGGAKRSPGRFVVGYCGNLDRYQNLDALVRGCAISAARSDLDLELRLITHGPENREISRLRDFSGSADLRVVPCRDYAAAAAEMAVCDVLTLPRRSGSGFPIKLLNYMSLGRPIVSNACGAKALTHGESGIVVSDDDSEALAQAFERLASNPQAAAGLGAAARAEFEQKFTWDRIVEAIEDVYSRTLAWRPATAGRTVLDGNG
jgi:glycosyltransferase involved in cell wall biosynthesis